MRGIFGGLIIVIVYLFSNYKKEDNEIIEQLKAEEVTDLWYDNLNYTHSFIATLVLLIALFLI